MNESLSGKFLQRECATGGHAFLFPLELISRRILGFAKLLECLRGRGEQTSECPSLMNGNRLKEITLKIRGMFCSTGVRDIPVVVTSNKPKMEIVENVLLMVQLVLRKSSGSYFNILFQQSPTTNTEQETTKSNFKNLPLYKAPRRVWNTSVNNSISRKKEKRRMLRARCCDCVTD